MKYLSLHNHKLLGSLFLLSVLLSPLHSGHASENDLRPNGIIKQSSESFAFRHDTSLATLPGLLGKVSFAPREHLDRIHQVRAFLLIDSQLLVVPLRFDATNEVFVGSFPTPKESLRYQFQLVYRNGKSLVSETFSIEPDCETKSALNFTEVNESFKSQRELLTKTQLLKRNSKLLSEAIVRIKKLLGAEEKL